jgi:4'-phosphopantetheinyl transferase
MPETHGSGTGHTAPEVLLAGRFGLETLLARPCHLPSPSPGEVALWTLVFPPPKPVPAIFREVLGPSELARAQRFVREEDRRQFLLSHGALRLILAAATGLAPGAVAYGRSERGKPYLVGGELAFNLSHAGNCVLVAVTAGSPVGVDVEPLRALSDADGLVERFFATEEIQAYRTCPGDRRTEAFFTFWTRKEAYVKALGGGLSIPLGAFAVSLDDPVRLVRPYPDAPVPGPRLCGALAPAGHVGALCGWFDRIVCRELDLDFG